jgi:GAF domain-containing protein
MPAGPPEVGTDRAPSIEEVGGASGLKTFVEEAERTTLVRLLERQSSISAMIAQSVQLTTVLERLTQVVEEQFEGMACSVFLVTPDRKHLHYVAGRNLPESYKRALDGSPIEFFQSRQSPSTVTDIAREAAWADCKDHQHRRISQRLRTSVIQSLQLS